MQENLKVCKQSGAFKITWPNVSFNITEKLKPGDEKRLPKNQSEFIAGKALGLEVLTSWAIFLYHIRGGV